MLSDELIDAGKHPLWRGISVEKRPLIPALGYTLSSVRALSIGQT